MSYSCSDFVDSILDALAIEVPEESLDSPSDQADLALAAIDTLKRKAAAFDQMKRSPRGPSPITPNPQSGDRP